jgi:hypothetical protein
MPNWCENEITIMGGDISPIIDFFENNNNDVLVMSKLIIKSSDNDESVYDYYGTKWDFTIAESNYQKFNEGITLSVLTAWSPIIPFLQKLSEKFNLNIDLFYCEGGNDFAGKCIIENGIIDDKEYRYMKGLYLFDNERFWHEIESLIETTDDDLDTFLSDLEFLDEREKNIITELFI